MIMEIFSVFDSKAAAFMKPFFAHNTAMAERAFSDEAATPGSPVAKHPEDYTLYHVGSFDDTTALITTFAQPKNLGFAELPSLTSFANYEENIGDA